MNDSNPYRHQPEAVNLATVTSGQLQTFHVPQHQRVTLSSSGVVMVSSNPSDSDDICKANNNLLTEQQQQFDQAILLPLDGRNYAHHHQAISDESHLQQSYVFVDPSYVQQLQYKESVPGVPIFMVAQSSESEAVSISNADQSARESDSVTFNSPPASPTSGEQSYPNDNETVTSVPEAEDEEWEPERAHFQKVVATFLQYKESLKCETEKTLAYIEKLPTRQKDLLSSYYTHLEEVLQCMEVNQVVFNLICSQEKKIFENQDEKFTPVNKKLSNLPQPTRFDFDKLQAVLKQIVRDWTLEGEHERSLCYSPIIEEVDRRFGMLKTKRDIRILIPGAGLARLAHELVNRTYVVEGNEFSLFMLFASNFILNRCGGNKKFKIHPWIHQHCNVVHHLDQIRPVTFPDIDPADITPNARFSMTAGDFMEIYQTPLHKETWDCVITCFFIDCANNIVSFIELIYSLLKPGGVWISLGPLLYHYADMPAEDSIEPPLDFLIEIIKNIGFSIDRNVKLPTKYAENRMSMLNYTYTSAFLCCTKPTFASPKARDKIKIAKSKLDVDGKRKRVRENRP